MPFANGDHEHRSQGGEVLGFAKLKRRLKKPGLNDVSVESWLLSVALDLVMSF